MPNNTISTCSIFRLATLDKLGPFSNVEVVNRGISLQKVEITHIE